MPILGIMASQISGHLWAPEGAYDALSTVTLSTTTASIEFAGIPTGYKHLQVRGFAQCNRATYGTDDIKLRFNGDSGSNYSYHALRGTGANPVEATSGASQAQIMIVPGAGTGNRRSRKHFLRFYH